MNVHFDVIEPIGFLHHTTDIKLRLTDANNNVDAENISFNTESADHLSSGYNEFKQLTASYTSSFVGFTLPSNNKEGITFNSSKNLPSLITHNPDGENDHTSSITRTASILVKDTPSVQFIFPSASTLGETEGNSGIGINTLNPDNNQFTLLSGVSTTATEVGDLPDNFTGSAITRFKIQPFVRESLGWAHGDFIGRIKAIQADGTDETVSSNITFNTGSDTKFISGGYDNNHQLTSSYSSSFCKTAYFVRS